MCSIVPNMPKHLEHSPIGGDCLPGKTVNERSPHGTGTRRLLGSDEAEMPGKMFDTDPWASRLGNKTGAQVTSLNVQTKDSWMALPDRLFKLFGKFRALSFKIRQYFRSRARQTNQSSAKFVFRTQVPCSALQADVFKDIL